jgi:putative ABC transport system substrate-binding protein
VNPDRRNLWAGTLAVLAVLAVPRLGVAQPSPRMRRIGHLSRSKSDAEVTQVGRKLRVESLRRLGWEEGKNLLIERRYAEGDIARLDTLAAELARTGVEPIIATLSPAIFAARRATQTIPIVMIGGNLSVEFGFVQSLARPAGNVTGTAVQLVELHTRTLQFMHELAPSRVRATFLGGTIVPGFEQVTRWRVARFRAPPKRWA